MKRLTRSKLRPAIKRSFERRYLFPIVSALVIVGGVLSGLMIGLALDLRYLGKEVGRLNTPGRPNSVITIYADDGKNELGQYAVLLHRPLKYEEIPDVMKKAIIAVEEPRFLAHDSLDPLRMAVSAIRTLGRRSTDDGPTLAQEISKILLSRNLTFKGKIQSWLLGIQIEHVFSKDQILWIFANHCPLGEIVYGVEAGAQTYFGKPAGILTYEECALLAGMPKAANYFSPAKNVQAAQERRNQVLNLMASAGYITQQEAEKGKARPVVSSPISPYLPHYSEFDYPLEEIKRHVEERYNGFGDLKVYSTINIDAQRKATQDVREELRQLDRAINVWRSAYKNIASNNNSSGIPTEEQLNSYQHPDWYGDIYQRDPYERDTFATGLITEINSTIMEATVRFGSYTAKLTVEDMGRSGKSPESEFRVGDLAEFYIKDVSKANKHLTVQLSQVPSASAAQITLDAATGEVITMVGGYDFNVDSNATQAYRQTGAVFRPFIYAAALEWGMTPNTLTSGAPISIAGWQPRNEDGSVASADLPLKTVVAKSMNVQAVHLMQTVGIRTVAKMVERFGIRVPMAPYLPSALGLSEMPLDQMVSAYSAFVNKGIRVEPHTIRRIETGDGKVIEEWQNTTYGVVNEYTALTMIDMMRNTIDNPAANGSQVLETSLAGSRGLSGDRSTDWFIGCTPTYVTGVWIGSPLGEQSLGPNPLYSNRAQRIFYAFMKQFLADNLRAKEERFLKPSPMPEDMKEMVRQRQRELALERAQMTADQDKDESEEWAAPSTETITTPRLEDSTLPPAPKTGDPDTRPNFNRTRRPQVQRRSRESEPAKKKGKKGDDGPQ